MPEVTIKYKSSKTLKVLKALSEYLDFSFPASPSKSKKNTIINGVHIIPGDSTVDISEMEKIFTGKKIDAKKLRERSWQRNK